MATPIIAGNWKMYKTTGEARAFVEALIPKVQGVRGVEVVICPPFTALGEALEAVRGSLIRVGAQNMHWADQGAYTGEVAPGMLKDLGCTYVILGHSERREYFGERDEEIGKKLQAALKHGLRPILCVGETLEQRERGGTQAVVEKQLRGALQGLDGESLSPLVIAYEPVWAIGTGRTASAADAEETIAFLRETLAAIGGRALAQKVPILYGGSVKPDNIKELMAQPNIDGALVGGASLEVDSFAAIVNY